MSRARIPRGVGQMVAFNWPDYVLALLVAAAAATVARLSVLPAPARAAGRAGAVVAAWWSGASLVAGCWLYDRSPLYRWSWLVDLLPAPPAAWANITAGFDESTARLTQLLGAGTTIDLFDPDLMTEPSIHRAHRAAPPAAGARRGTPSDLPFADGSLDAAFVIFAAHELRDRRDRRALFAELRRTLRPGGHVALVEHARDAANVVAFGPAALHFFPLVEWRHLARDGGFDVVRESRQTPFVHALILHAG